MFDFLFQPSFLSIVNESHMHSVPKSKRLTTRIEWEKTVFLFPSPLRPAADSETHFQVTVVSESFVGMPLIKRHQKVFDILKEELKNGVHALSLKASVSKLIFASELYFKPPGMCLCSSIIE